MYGVNASHVKRAAVVVGYASGKVTVFFVLIACEASSCTNACQDASVHVFDEAELEMLYEQFKVLRQLYVHPTLEPIDASVIS